MGRIICCGLGPGDPELMSVRADRLIRTATDVAYFRKKGRPGQARRIIEGMLAADVQEYPMEYPVTTELPFDSPEYNRLLADFYDGWSSKLKAIAQSRDVVVLCEGDPFFYGSFMHLYVRLREQAQIDVVPGIPGMTGCWNAAGVPMTWGDDVLAVVMATMSEAEMTRHIATSNAVVIMKIGRNLAKVRRALIASGKLENAWLVERGTMADQTIARLVDVSDDVSVYFSTVLVHGDGRRPESPE